MGLVDDVVGLTDPAAQLLIQKAKGAADMPSVACAGCVWGRSTLRVRVARGPGPAPGGHAQQGPASVSAPHWRWLRGADHPGSGPAKSQPPQRLDLIMMLL